MSKIALYLVTPHKYRVWLIFSAALLVRVVLWVIHPDMNTLTPDVLTYQANADSFLKKGVIESSIIMPLFPVLLATLGGWMTTALNVVMSALMCVLVYGIVEKMFKDHLAAVIAALIIAFYPYYIFYSYILLTENLFIFLFILSVYLLVRQKMYWSFAVAVLAILTRPIPEVLFPVLVVYTSCFIHKRGIKSSALYLFKYLAVYCLLMAPWWVHNYRLYDMFVRLNLGYGINFYIGNVNLKGQGLFIPAAGADFSMPPGMDNMSVAQKNEYLTMKTKEFIRNEPGTFIKYFFIKVFRFWKLVPTPENIKHRNVLFFAPLIWFDLLLVLALAGFYRLRKRYRAEAGFFAIIVAYFTVVHGLVFGDIRYRLPLDFIVMIGASLFISSKLSAMKIFHELFREEKGQP